MSLCVPLILRYLPQITAIFHYSKQLEDSLHFIVIRRNCICSQLFKDTIMDSKPPPDTRHLVYLTLVLHGLGILTSWNMFITAKDYFVDYKLKNAKEYSENFLVYVGWASQIPNLFFNWLNVFVRIGGSLTARISWSLILEALIFVVTVVLAMVDSSGWPIVFFWFTMITVFLLNTLNAIYQNSIYGIGAQLPPKYLGAIVLGHNVCGTLVVLLSWATSSFENIRTSAIYYFIGGAFVLLVCFDTFYALPLNRFYRYHTSGHEQKKDDKKSGPTPYCLIFKKAGFQLYNIFITFFVSLSSFPAVISDIKPIQDGFLGDNFVLITCFLTFNFMAMLGSMAASFKQFPGPRVLTVYTTIRLVFIPFFLLCNYQAPGRTLAVLFKNDWLYWLGSAIMAFTSGHASSLGFIYIGRTVDSEHAPTAGMLGSAIMVTGIMTGITFARLAPIFVSL